VPAGQKGSRVNPRELGILIEVRPGRDTGKKRCPETKIFGQ
jgi:hypothetical protein